MIQAKANDVDAITLDTVISTLHNKTMMYVRITSVINPSSSLTVAFAKRWRTEAVDLSGKSHTVMHVMGDSMPVIERKM
jgi:hypothetical protein